jgi:hypothetical protein
VLVVAHLHARPTVPRSAARRERRRAARQQQRDVGRLATDWAEVVHGVAGGSNDVNHTSDDENRRAIGPVTVIRDDAKRSRITTHVEVVGFDFVV